jgi:UDP-N-acetylglucosamine 4,6-dehydratase
MGQCIAIFWDDNGNKHRGDIIFFNIHEGKMKEILITGGTGTVGNILAKHFIGLKNVRRVVIFSRDEYKQAKMKEKYASYKSSEKLRYFIGDIRDRERLTLAMARVTHVIHAAALKRIELCTTNPEEAIKTNIMGTDNVIMACVQAGVKRATLISTDKAVDATTFYGKTKAVAEDMWIYANHYRKIFNAIRMGNITGSRGSVLEKWLGEKYLSTTDRECTRFHVTKEMLIRTVERAFADTGIWIHIPKMKSYKLGELARVLGKKTISIGLRDREKLHEYMFSGDERKRLYEEKDEYLLALIKNPYPPWASASSADYIMDEKDVHKMIEYAKGIV